MDKSKLEDAMQVLSLGEAIQNTILEASSPMERQDTPGGGVGTFAAYDVETVLSALSWASANFIVQSGQFPNLRDRKRAIETMGRRILAYCPQVEKIVAGLGMPELPKSN